MNYSIYDFVRCPERSCDYPNVGIDYYHDGERIFFNFGCINCGTGALEDDFRWYVRCPNCNPDPTGGVDHVDGSIETDGEVKFECEKCDCSASEHVVTRWDESSEQPKFEPNNY